MQTNSLDRNHDLALSSKTHKLSYAYIGDLNIFDREPASSYDHDNPPPYILGTAQLLERPEFKTIVPEILVEQINNQFRDGVIDTDFTQIYSTNPYLFSSSLADKNNHLKIKGFEHGGYYKGLSVFLGPLSEISTSKYGLATYEFTTDLIHFEFKSYVEMGIWTFRKLYRTSITILNNNDYYLLCMMAPNDHWQYGMNGLYLIYPEIRAN